MLDDTPQCNKNSLLYGAAREKNIFFGDITCSHVSLFLVSPEVYDVVKKSQCKKGTFGLHGGQDHDFICTALAKLWYL